MNNNINYQLELNKILDSLKQESNNNNNNNNNNKYKLLLHCCCAPCSSYVLEYLVPFFNITVLFYNPNISPLKEHDFRKEELHRLIDEMKLNEVVKIIDIPFDPTPFEELSRGLEELPEGSARCFKCYYLRLSYSAMLAKKANFDFFTTTLTISPYKSASKLNEIGRVLEQKYNVKYLYSDFKKNNGYKRSIELSKLYNLYRQNYCGCKFSKLNRILKDKS